MKPIKITETTDRTYFSYEGCDVKKEDVTIEIYRPDGTSMVEYPCLEVGNGKLLFVWDDVIRERPKGRYIGHIKFKKGSCKKMCVQIEVSCECKVTQHENQNMTKGDCI